MSRIRRQYVGDAFSNEFNATIGLWIFEYVLNEIDRCDEAFLKKRPTLLGNIRKND